ncbi:MAG: GspE/PulE family protein [Planctomycetota bacterium]
MARQLIGEILKAQGIIEDGHIEDGLRLQNETGAKLGQALIRLGHIDDVQLARALARQSKLPFVDLSRGRIPDEVIDLIPANLAEEYGIVPVKVAGREVIVALADPVQAFNLENLRFLLNLEFRCAVAAESAIKAALKRYYEVEKSSLDPAAATKKAEPEDGEAPIIRLVDSIIEDAVRTRASDIHLEGFEDQLRVRYRVDGVCKTVARHPRHLHGPVISRLKILAGVDIAEKRKPQDGRIQTRVLGKEIDMRVSILPSMGGEAMVMRILDKVEGLVDLDKLGFEGEDLQRFRRIIKRPNGIFLVTGPTGSGKTTTLYAGLKELNRPDVKIITAENPIEYNLKGINQCQVRHSIGLDFAHFSARCSARRRTRDPGRRDPGPGDGARSRSRPRSPDTSCSRRSTPTTPQRDHATRGHGRGALPRLDLAGRRHGAAPRCRTLCKHCKEGYQPGAAELATIGVGAGQAGGCSFRPKGCDRCNGQGYSGRIGIYELMQMDDTIREMIFNGASHLKSAAGRSRAGCPPRWTGPRKVLSGRTSIEEVLRVVSQDATLDA